MSRSPSTEHNEQSPLLRRSPSPSSTDTTAVFPDVDRTTVQGPTDISPSTRYGIMAGIWMATFAACVNTTLVTTLLPSISGEFHRSHQASWLGTSYLLATCTFNPLYGRLCDVLGRRRATQLALLLCGTGVILCGLASSMELLIAARFICGIGGGGIFTTASIITSDMYSLRSRGLAQGIMNIANGLGVGLGGPIGGLISDSVGWRWAFLAQAPFIVVALLLITWKLEYVTPGKGKTTEEITKRIDYIGIAVLMGTVLSALLFLDNRFQGEYPWSSVAVALPLAFAVSLALVFVVVEVKFAREPVMPLFLLKHRISVLVAMSNFLVANANFAVMYFFPMWFQTVMLGSASNAGLHVAPNSAAMSLGSLFAGWMMHRTGRYKWLNVVCGLLPTLGCVLLTRMRPDAGWPQLWLSIVPSGFGNAVVLQTTLVALLAHLPPDALAVGTGFGILFRGLGQVGGVAVSSAIFQSRLDTELHKRIAGPGSEEIIRRIRQSARVVLTLPPDLQPRAQASYDLAIKTVFIFAGCCTFGAFLVRLPIPEKDLDKGSGSKKRGGDEEQTQEPEASEDVVRSVEDEMERPERDDTSTNGDSRR